MSTVNSFVNSLTSDQLEMIVHRSQNIQRSAKNRITKNFMKKINGYTTHNILINSNVTKKPLLNTQVPMLAKRRANLFSKKIQNLKTSRNLLALQQIIKNPNAKYINSERRNALATVQRLRKEFKNASRAPNNLKTGFGKFGVKAKQGMSRFRNMFRREKPVQYGPEPYKNPFNQ